MPRKRLACGLTALLLLGAHAADAELPPRPPDLAIGVVPFTRTDEALNCHIEQQLRNLLDIHGARVRMLDASVDVSAAFASHPDLDFVVTGALNGGNPPTAFAKVFARSNTSPRTASGPCDAVASELAGKVTDNHAAGKALTARAALAEATLAGNPDDFNSLMTLGLLNLHANRWPEARPFFERAVRNKPDDLQAQLNLALCYKQDDDRENWLLHLSNAEDINPDDDGVLIGLGNYYAATGDPRKAVGYYERAKASGLNADVPLWNLAVAYSEMENLDLALASLAAIPTTSLYYPEAQEWAARLDGEKRRFDQIRQRDAAPRKSLLSLLGLPDGVVTLFVGVALVLCLIPYFGGKKFFNFEVPRARQGQRATLKLVGPLVFAALLAGFLPMWRDKGAPIPEPPRSAPPSVVEADRTESSVRYLGSPDR